MKGWMIVLIAWVFFALLGLFLSVPLFYWGLLASFVPAELVLMIGSYAPPPTPAKKRSSTTSTYIKTFPDLTLHGEFAFLLREIADYVEWKKTHSNETGLALRRQRVEQTICCWREQHDEKEAPDDPIKFLCWAAWHPRYTRIIDEVLDACEKLQRAATKHGGEHVRPFSQSGGALQGSIQG